MKTNTSSPFEIIRFRDKFLTTINQIIKIRPWINGLYQEIPNNLSYIKEPARTYISSELIQDIYQGEPLDAEVQLNDLIIDELAGELHHKSVRRVIDEALQTVKNQDSLNSIFENVQDYDLFYVSAELAAKINDRVEFETEQFNTQGLDQNFQFASGVSIIGTWNKNLLIIVDPYLPPQVSLATKKEWRTVEVSALETPVFASYGWKVFELKIGYDVALVKAIHVDAEKLKITCLCGSHKL